MQDKIDLEYYVSEISDPVFGTFFAIEDDEPVKHIDGDLDSVQEALDNYGKVFIELGYFSYDETNETRLMFDSDEVIIGLTDQYYDKYKFSMAGYGIFLDSDLNVECGWYTTEAPPSGHGPGETTIHNFKNARKDDIIKEKIYSLLSWTGIENSHATHHESNPTELIDSETNIETLQNQLTSIEDILTNLETDSPQEKEDILINSVSTAEDLLADLKMKLYPSSYYKDDLIKVNKIEKEINKIEKEIIPNLKQNFYCDLFKKLHAEIDKDYYSSLCRKISDFFSLNYKTNDEILNYLCNNFPKNSVYLFILHYEPNALPNITFDKGLHKRGLLIRLKNGTVLSNWRDVSKKDNVEYVIEDLSNKKKLSSKYESCTSLKSIKLTGINKAVTDMSYMFVGCISLVDVSCLGEWDVSNVTHMQGMFSNCDSLVDVSFLDKWNVSNVTNMQFMFNFCRSLVDISGLSNWDVSHVTNMRHMFYDCRSLIDISGLSNWDVSHVTNMEMMFSACNSLVDVSALSEWDVSNVEEMTCMFDRCGSLVDISGLSNWDVSNVTDMQLMFEYCESLVDISALGKWDMSNVIWVMGMFENCKSLVDISSLGDWDLSSLTQMTCMFEGCKSLVDISALGEWNMSNVKWISGMFSRCESLVDISSLSDWDLSSVTEMRDLFMYCKSLADVSDLGKWDVSTVTNMQGMFAYCDSLVDVSGLGKWDVSNVTNMKSIFSNCESLVDNSSLSDWDLSSVTEMNDMFEGCKSLVDDSLLKYWSKKID